MEDKKYLAFLSIVASVLSVDWNDETFKNKQSLLLNLSESWVRAHQIAAKNEGIQLHVIEALDILLAERDNSFNMEVIVACIISAAADAEVSEKEGKLLNSLCRVLEVDYTIAVKRVKELISSAIDNG